MTFPVYIHLFGYAVHPHALFELIAYPAGFALWRFTRRRDPAVEADFTVTLTTVAFAILGAGLGAKLLAYAEDWRLLVEYGSDWRTWVGGKTIVGGLLGGWAGVELAKRMLGVRRRTGDAYVLPLALAIAIGRVGCFLTGLPDRTFGTPTALPWAVDFGDGIGRHPTQVYEIIAVLLLGVGLTLFRRSFPRPGDRFRGFMLGYFAFRFGVEFIKPVYNPYLGLSAIQLASLVGVVWAAWGLSAHREHVVAGS